jgi:arabinan endo-1,5-alpha-L-arabinosidase
MSTLARRPGRGAVAAALVALVALATLVSATPASAQTARPGCSSWLRVIMPSLCARTEAPSPAPTPAPSPSPSPVPAPSPSPSPSPTPTPTPPAAGPTVPPSQPPGPGRVVGDTGAHDPSVVRRPDGTYLVATTGPGIALKTSTDRTTFRDIGRAFPGGTPWTRGYSRDDPNLWAPDLSYHNGRYYLYYSASSFGSRRSATFLATSTTGAPGSWEHQGTVVETTESSDHNAIDANLFVDDDGRWWLTYGSHWSGIKLVPLDPRSGMPSGGRIDLAARNDAGGAIEAPTLFKRDGTYYLFTSFDRCCQGARSTYRIMVGRSSSVTGPYVDRSGRPLLQGGGTQVLASHGNVHGPGHQDVLADADGDVLWYHYYRADGAPVLGVNLLGWDREGWPFAH